MEYGAEFQFWKRNLLGLIIDSALFAVAFSFSDMAIISVFLLKATDSIFIVGLFQTFRTFGFYFSQILSADVSGKQYKKNVWIRWTIVGRLCLALAVLTVFLTENIQLIGLSFFLSLVLFQVFDGYCNIPYLEYIVKAIPPTRRGSFFGLQQFFGGLGPMMAGFLVVEILGNQSLVFPTNYGFLLLTELIILLFGVLPLFFLKENPDKESKEERSILATLKAIPRILKDNSVKKLVTVQLLVSCCNIAAPFYSVFAVSTWQFEESFIGYFVLFQMAGRFVLSFLWANLGNKGKNKQIIEFSSLLLLASPLISMTIAVLQPVTEIAVFAVVAVFAFLGASLSGIFIGFNNYVMAMEDRRQRPLILGFLNFLNVTTSILPVLGSVMIGNLPYEVVFLTSAIPIGFGLLLALSLKQSIDD